MIKRAFILAFLALLLVVSPVLAQEGVKGTIKGQLVNKTKGGGTVAGQEVSLKTLRSNNEVSSSPTKTDTKGGFVFSDLNTESIYSYKITIKYQEADYESDVVKFAAGETSKSLELTVFDSTTSPADITVSQAHTVVLAGKGELEVVEYFVFSNRGDKTYVGFKDLGDGRKETLKFSLPRGATELQYGQGLMECCVVPVDGGFVDTMAFIAGNTSEVVYSYKIKKPSDNYLLSQTLFSPVANYDLLVQDVDGSRVSSAQLTAQEPVQMGETRFTRLSARDLAAGTAISASLSGLGKSGSSVTTQQAAIVVVLLISAFGIGFLLLRRRRTPALANAPAGGGGRGEKESLLMEMAQLDDNFEAGKIPQERYRRLRAQKKARLAELLRRSKGRGDVGG